MGDLRKVLHYQRAEILEEATADGRRRRAPSTLAALLRSALAKLPQVGRRTADFGASKRFITDHQALATATGALLVEYTEGAFQPFVHVDTTADRLPVKLLRPPGAGDEFLEGLLYLYVLDNHVVISGGKALKADALEGYLNWLIVREAGLLTSGCFIALREYTPSTTQDAIPWDRVKRIQISPSFEPHFDGLSPAEFRKLPPAEQKQVIASREKQQMESKRGQVAQLIMGYLARELRLRPDLGLDDALLSEHVEATVELNYRGRVPADGVRLLSTVAELLGAKPDMDYEIQLPGVGVLRSGELKLTQAVTVRGEGGVPHFGAILQEMHNWLRQLLDTSQVLG